MNSPAINPLAIAAKTAAVRNMAAPRFAAGAGRQPRLIELLWFIQWHSTQPGGLPKFTADFLSLFSGLQGTAAMRRIAKTGESYTPTERQEVIASIPDRLDSWTDIEAQKIIDDASHDLRGYTVSGGGWRLREADLTPPNLAFISRQNYSYFSDLCHRFAVAELPTTLARFCAEPDFCLPDAWYFDGLEAALVEAMDAHCARALQTIAPTSVAAGIFETLDFAWLEKSMVEIIGDSRFGKTEAVKAWCAARPGLARLVKTPCDDWPSSLFQALASALGLSPSLKPNEVKSAIETIFRQSDLGFVFDEAAWLLPQKFSARTTPFRLNWVRSQILDNNCPVALVTTPQFKSGAEQTYEKISGFDMAQWRGRIMRTYRIPKDLPEADLAAVVSAHLPGINAACARRVVAVALISEAFLFAVEKIARNARAEARKNQRANVEEPDIETAIVLSGYQWPTPSAPSPISPIPVPSHLDNHAGRRIGNPVPHAARIPAELAPPVRQTAPTLKPFNPFNPCP